MTPSLKTGPEPSRTDDPIVLLVTGSRRWESREIVYQALLDAVRACTPPGASPRTHPFSNMILRHGGARGLDTLAKEQAEAWGMKIDLHSPRWRDCTDQCPPNCRKTRRDGSTWCTQAGFRRNKAMVEALPRPTITLVFPIGGPSDSRGTWNCATHSQVAGIPTWWYEA